MRILAKTRPPCAMSAANAQFHALIAASNRCIAAHGAFGNEFSTL